MRISPPDRVYVAMTTDRGARDAYEVCADEREAHARAKAYRAAGHAARVVDYVPGPDVRAKEIEELRTVLRSLISCGSTSANIKAMAMNTLDPGSGDRWLESMFGAQSMLHQSEVKETT